MIKDLLQESLEKGDFNVDHIFGKSSDLPPKHGWETGFYSCRCNRCKETFQGRKRAYECADCAYDESIDRNPPTKEDLELWNKMLDDIMEKYDEK